MKLTNEQHDFVKSLLKLQGESGTMDSYGIGFFNGIEFVRATMTSTEPQYKEDNENEN